MSFWPAVLTAHVALKDWVAARRVGEALTKEIDSGSVKLSETKEKLIRSHYEKYGKLIKDIGIKLD